MASNESEKILEQIKRIAEQGDSASEPVMPSPKANDVVISKDDLESLIAMAKSAQSKSASPAPQVASPVMPMHVNEPDVVFRYR
jgi:hypothetical protein